MTVLSTRWRQGSSWNSPFESNQALLHRWLCTYPSSKTQVLHLLQTTADSSTRPSSFASSWQGGTRHRQTQTEGGSQDARGVMSKPQQLSQGTKQAVICWLKDHKSTRPLPLFPQDRGGTGKCYPHYLISVLPPSPTTTSLGPPKQPVCTVLFYRIFLLLGL